VCLESDVARDGFAREFLGFFIGSWFLDDQGSLPIGRSCGRIMAAKGKDIEFVIYGKNQEGLFYIPPS